MASIYAPHVSPLNRYADDLRMRTGFEAPYFDPADGGVNARVLLLLEKPGPMTIATRTGGSGLISRDNDDWSAEYAFSFWQETGFERNMVCAWNAIPVWNGTIDIALGELETGIKELRTVLAMMPELRSIVLVGRKAQKAHSLLAATGRYKIFECFHTGKKAKISPHAHVREGWMQTGQVWREACVAAL